VAYELVEYAENPLTIVYSQAKNLAKNVPAGDGLIDMRIVRYAFCEQLLQRFRKPIVSTSATEATNIRQRSSPTSRMPSKPAWIMWSGTDSKRPVVHRHALGRRR